jgi:hypothetical protein
VSEAEILEVLACPDIEVEPPLDVMLPDHLVPPERLATDLQVGCCLLLAFNFLFEGEGFSQRGSGVVAWCCCGEINGCAPWWVC